MSFQAITCSIITIGDELLIGQTLDTNSAWMARQLNQAGIWLKRRVAVGDEAGAITSALDQEKEYSDIILLTGGLGPTSDDITKEVLSRYFSSPLVVHQKIREDLRDYFIKRGLPILDSNLRQADLPRDCQPISNEKGTAPGMWFEREGKVFVSMPGVPAEMEDMMIRVVIPRIKQRYVTPEILHRTLLTAGQGESFVANRLEGFENQLPPQIKLAYLPSFGYLKLRLTAVSSELPDASRVLQVQGELLARELSDILLAEQDIGIGALTGRLLVRLKATIATAESCTGGYIAHLITQVPGSSAYFKGSVVAYHNEVKTSLLGVDPDLIASHGAVSGETVGAMARGGRQLLGADYCLATSGILGPEGGTPEKPVGTVWMAACAESKLLTRKIQLRFNREQNIQAASNQALLLVLELLREAGAVKE